MTASSSSGEERATRARARARVVSLQGATWGRVGAGGLVGVSGNVRRTSVETANILEEDRGFARAVMSGSDGGVPRAPLARVLRVEPGTYRWFDLLPDGQRLLGALVLDGVLIRQVIVGERRCGELVSAGAILRPWDHFGEEAPMPFEVDWRVLQSARVALLDQRWVRFAATQPQLVELLVQRAIERAHTVAFNVAIHCLQHVDLRLLTLFWHLADRFGHVTTDGIIVPLPLRHEDLAELVGTRRPTVSQALAKLARDGLLTRRADRTWLLAGDPPAEVRDMRRTRDLALRDAPGPAGDDVAKAPDSIAS